MSLSADPINFAGDRFPRSRGDEPYSCMLIIPKSAFSPLTRG